jgi:DNA-binding IclR family transcriptional regulator
MTATRAHPLATGDRVRSVSRALAVLDALAANSDGQTAKGVAAAVGLAVSTTYHLLNTLVAAGYAARDPQTRLFALGPRIPQLHQAFMARSLPSPAIRPFLHALHQTTEATVAHERLFGDDSVIVDLIPGREPPPIGVGYVGLSLPAHLTASGRVLLAWLSPERRRAYVTGRYGHSAGPFPPADGAHLEAHCSRLRDDGYEIDRGDTHAEVRCLAAPIMTAAGDVHDVLTLITNRARFVANESAMIAAMVAITSAASSVADTGLDTAVGEMPVSRELAEAVVRALDVPT